MNPLVSVVTPSFKQASYLEETMRSVLEQDYPNVEYIVIDGGSTDGSVEVIRSHADRLAYWVSEPDQGQSDAINKGLGRSRGEIMAYLNSDDTYRPGAIRHAVEAFNAHPRAELVYGTTDYVDEKGVTLRPAPGRPLERANMLRGAAYLSQPAAFWRRRAWDRIGPFRTDLHYSMDFEFWLRFGERYEIVFAPAVRATYRLHGASKTGGGWDPFAEEVLRVLAEHHRRAHLLRVALGHPGLWLRPSMLLFLLARLAPQPLMRAINLARGYPPTPA